MTSILLCMSVVGGTIVVWDHDADAFTNDYFITNIETVDGHPSIVGGIWIRERDDISSLRLKYYRQPIPNFGAPSPSFWIDEDDIVTLHAEWDRSYLNENSFPGNGVGSFDVMISTADYEAQSFKPFVPLSGQLNMTFEDGMTVHATPVLVRLPEPTSFILALCSVIVLVLAELWIRGRRYDL